MNSAAESSSTSRLDAVGTRGAARCGTLPRLSTAYEQNLVDPFGRDHSGGKLQCFLEAQAERHERVVVPPHGPLAVMREPPHPEIEQTRGARRHAEHGAALQRKMVLRQFCRQAFRLVSPLVGDEVVKRGPHRRVQWR